MGFEKIETRARTGRTVTTNPDGVSVGLIAASTKTHGPRLMFYIGVNVLGLMGLKAGDRVNVAEGNGPDHGVFLISPAQEPREGYTLTPRKNDKMATIAIRTSLLKTLRNASEFIAEPATFDRFGSALRVLVWKR